MSNTNTIVHPGFEPVAKAFEAHGAADPTHSAPARGVPPWRAGARPDRGPEPGARLDPARVLVEQGHRRGGRRPHRAARPPRPRRACGHVLARVRRQRQGRHHGPPAAVPPGRPHGRRRRASPSTSCSSTRRSPSGSPRSARSGDPAPRSCTTASPSGRWPTSSCGAPTAARSRRCCARTSPGRARSTCGWGPRRPRTTAFVPFQLPAAEDFMAMVAELQNPDMVDAIPTTAFPAGGAAPLLGLINEVPFRRGGAPAPAGWPAPVAWPGCTPRCATTSAASAS